MGLIRRKVINAIFLFFWSICGCGTACLLDVQKVDPGELVVLEKQRALVFGRIFVTENDKVKVPYGLRTMKPVLMIFHTESRECKFLSVEKDGSFYWTLPRGSYAIAEVSCTCHYYIKPQVIFEVPSEGDVFYLGVLKLDVVKNRFRVRMKSVEIFDEFDVAKSIIMKRYKDFSFKIEKSLICVIPDKSPTASISICPAFVPGLGGW